MKVYIVESYCDPLDGPFIEPTCYASREAAIKRCESQTYTDSDGLRNWAYWRELTLVGLEKE